MSANAIAELIAASLNDFFIQVMKAVATLCWLLEKVAAGCMRFLTEENLWQLLLEGTLATLRDSMPGILGNVFFGSGAGVGLMYLALMLGGVFLILPALNSSRPVEPSRALLWGVVVGALFIASLWGYDLIRYIESLRQNMTTVIVEGIGGDATELDSIVQVPMYATDSETEAYGFTLPEQFEAYYFYAPDPEEDYDEYVIVIGVWPVQHSWTFLIESHDSQHERREDAQTGLAVAALTLIPGVVLLLFGLIFAVLAAAALVLVIFFVVALPVGFFESGAQILTHIVRQYSYLFAVTLLTVTLVAVMVASGQLDISETTPENNPNLLMTKIPVLLVVMVALSYVSSMATRAMTDTFGVVSTSVRASFAPLNASGSMPAGSGLLSDVAQAALNVTGAAALAGVTGGAGMAVMAGTGALLGNVSEPGGRAAATLAHGLAPDSPYAHVFASGARSGRGAHGMAVTGSSAGYARRTLKRRRAEREAQGARAFEQGSRAPHDREQHAWQSREEGTFLAADSALVEQGVREFREGKGVTARSTFTRAFGSRAVAESVMARLAADPLQAQLPVAGITEQARRAAHRSGMKGQAIFEGDGTLSPAFQKSLWEALRADPALRRLNPADAAHVDFVAALTGASLRPLTPIWQDPLATRKLARTVLAPETPEIETADPSALLSLQGLARIEGWQEPALEALFEATRSGQSRAALTHGERLRGVVKDLYQHKELRGLDPDTAREAARLALLVTRDGQSIGGPVPSAAAENTTPPPDGPEIPVNPTTPAQEP